MLDSKDFNFFETQNTFDFKGFFVKILGLWKWFILSLLVALLIAYNFNIRKEKKYGIESLIVVNDENNSFFSTSTSLIFNYGGVSEKIQKVITTLKSRSHNEAVVSELKYYIDYLKEGEYFFEDVYGATPFVFEIDTSKPQLVGVPIKIVRLNEKEFELTIDFNTYKSRKTIQYNQNSYTPIVHDETIYSKKFNSDDIIANPFVNGKFDFKEFEKEQIGQEFYIQFNDFNETVAKYKSISVDADVKAQSVILLQLQGANKIRLVEYLNTTVSVLKKNQLNTKNIFATNTIKFIDSTLSEMENQIKDAEVELKNFRKGKNVFELEDGGQVFSEKLTELDIQKEEINSKVRYLNNLNTYLTNSTDFSKLPAPTVAGITEPNIVGNITKLIQLSTKREELSYSVKSGSGMFTEFDVEMKALKKVLLENISSTKKALSSDLAVINSRVSLLENKVNKLPELQQEHVKVLRKYDLKEGIFNTFLQKRSEAEIIKAGNISDVEFIDPAKDTGGGLQSSKNSVNYLLALIVGILIPLLIVFILFLLDNNINTTNDIQKLTQIPIIGVVGKKNTENNLSVFLKPKSPLAESFRAIRSSLQYLYKKKNLEGSKILMLTSSISGEGKTFCSINLATVFALSEKKTVIVGLDLRKPRIFGDFNIANNKGVVNYLIGNETLEAITESTHIPYLDLISSGPIPPNPAELLMSDAMEELIKELKEKYDYIILDTPPVGLVSDALELAKFCDATLYVVKQGYTKKGMLHVVNEKHKRGELNNISILLNGFVNKEKFGYGYGYGYGYGAYGESYHDNEPSPKGWRKIKQRWKKK